MRLPKDLMTAPIAAERASARCNEVDRSAAVMRAPCFDIAMNIDGTLAPAMVADQDLRSARVAAFWQKFPSSSRNESPAILRRSCVTTAQSQQQFLHREFAFA